jgi:hypothetical protein
LALGDRRAGAELAVNPIRLVVPFAPAAAPT